MDEDKLVDTIFVVAGHALVFKMRVQVKLNL